MPRSQDNLWPYPQPSLLDSQPPPYPARTENPLPDAPGAQPYRSLGRRLLDYTLYDSPPSRTLQDWWSGVTAPGDAWTRGMSMDEATQRGASMANAAAMFSSGIRPNLNRPNMNIGVSGMGGHYPEKDLWGGVQFSVPPVRAGPRPALDYAQHLTEHPWLATPNAIREATGWWQDPIDKHFKTEISDQPARMTNAWYDRPYFVGRLSDAFYHPEAYSNYPHLKDIGVEIVHDPTLASEKWNAAGEPVPARSRPRPQWYPPNEDDPHGMISIAAADAQDAKTQLLTEMQRRIQEHEGWAQGIQPGDPSVLPNLLRSRQHAQSLSDMLDVQRELHVEHSLENYARKTPEQATPDDMRLATQVWMHEHPELYTQAAQAQHILNAPPSPQQARLLSAGDVEAMNTATRQDLSEYSRRHEVSPESTMSYPPEFQFGQHAKPPPPQFAGPPTREALARLRHTMDTGNVAWISKGGT